MSDILACELEPEEGLILGADAKIGFLQTIPTVLTGGFLIRTFCKFQIFNSDNFPILDRLIVSRNYEGIRLYNNCENKPTNQRPVIGGPNFNTEINTDIGPWYQVPEGGYVVLTNFGSFWQRYSWITVAGYRVWFEMKDCEDLQYDRLDEFQYPVYGSGLYGFSNRERYWWGRDFKGEGGKDIEGYTYLPQTEKGQSISPPTELQEEKFNWVWPRRWDLIISP